MPTRTNSRSRGPRRARAAASSEDRFWPALRLRVRRQGRCVWRGDGRLHIALREPGPLHDAAALHRAVAEALSQERGVRWAQVNAALGVVIVAFDARALPRSRDAQRSRIDRLEDRLIVRIVAAERAHGVGGRAFPARRRPEIHPGDWLPLARSVAELGLDVGSIAGGLALRAAGVQPGPIRRDLAAALDVVGNVPVVRKWVERRIGIASTEFALEAGGAAIHTLLHGEVGAAASTLHRLLRLRELRARRALWPQWEARLCGRRDDAAVARQRQARPQPLPDGPVERYAARAAAGTAGAFAGTLLATGGHEAAAAVFAGVPKPARLGREAFAAQLGWRLAQAGILVVEPQVLRRLERMDCVVLAPSLCAPAARLRPLLDAAERGGLQAVCVGSWPAAGEDGRDPARLRHIDGAPVAAVRRLQAEGRGVLYLGRGADPAYAAADCAVALDCAAPPPRRGRAAAAGAAAPWGADLICPDGVAQGAALVRAACLARVAAEQAMELSLCEVVLGIALASAGLDERRTGQIMLAVSSTSIIAMANGVRLAQSLNLPEAGSARPAQPDWHALPPLRVLRRLGSRRRAGLDAAQVRERRQLSPPAPTLAGDLLRTAWAELRNPMTPALGAGAALSALIGGVVDAALILATLGLNGVYGGAQRLRTERLVRRLARRQARRVRVRRSGRGQRIDAAALVVGDILLLESGDTVPADCRLLDARGLEVDESALTGESLPVAKSAAPCAADAPLAERSSMLYEGSSIAAGTAEAVVVALGEQTETGRAGAGTARVVGVGVEARLQQLTRYTAPVAGAAGLLLAGVGRIRGRPMRDVLGAAVNLAVAAVPEGLPLLAGVAQATVAGRLSDRGALVRDPRVIEALGRMTVLCADKTGTLTQGSIRLRVVSDGERDAAPDALDAAQRAVLAAALRASPSSRNGSLAHLTDRTLVEGAHAVGIGSDDGLDGWQRLAELPFEPGRAFHAGLARHRGGVLLSVKGAPETVLPRCTQRQGRSRRLRLDAAARAQLDAQAGALARRGFRVLAVAERAADGEDAVDEASVADLVFRGFIGYADSVRPSARDAVADLRRAGIRVVMLTGDHPITAEAIARDLGIANGHGVLTGSELDALDEAELAAQVDRIAVFARVTPAHKVRIVRAYQQARQVVGMTGDGANDAPAIRLADIGIALGERSTEAARGAAGIVIADGRIETLVAAVREGRAMWQSVRDAVSLLVGGNLGEILFTLVGGLASGVSPLNARQLLLVNLLTDAVPALAVALRGSDASGADALLRAGPEESLGPELYREIARRALATTTGATSAWLAARLTGSRERAGSVALLALTGTQLAQTLLAGRGSRRVTLACAGSLAALLALVETPGVSRFFGSRPLGPLGLAQAAGGAAVGLGAHLLLPRLERWAAALRTPAPGRRLDEPAQPGSAPPATARRRSRPAGRRAASGATVRRATRHGAARGAGRGRPSRPAR